MSNIERSRWARGKREIRRRLDQPVDGERPMFKASNIHYEFAERTRGVACGGIGAVQLLARKVGLVDAIDRRLHLFKLHLPYHESDHVLNIAFNLLCGGTCLQDIERRRNDAVFLDALDAERIPDPTTAGDFCRRFAASDVLELQEAIDEARLKVWAKQPAEFFREAVIDMDGSLVETSGECKAGMDIAYDGTWGYHPLLVSLANTSELLCVINRSGNRPSHEGAAEAASDAMKLCFRGGFQRVLLRGDTDFTQTKHLDGWTDDPRVRFIFGIDAMPNLKELAENIEEEQWRRLVRPSRRRPAAARRRRPKNAKEKVVREREFENIVLESEQVAELDYRPTACQKTYRLVVVRKNLSIERGEKRLFDEVRYFFYLTNDRERSADTIVFEANGRCHQENLIEQLKNGVRSLQAPVDNLVSNWAYMVMASLAWDLKAWFALLLPEEGRWAEQHRDEKQTVLAMEFKKFVSYFMAMPCQIVRTSRRLLYRFLSWNPWQAVFLRLLTGLRC